MGEMGDTGLGYRDDIGNGPGMGGDNVVGFEAEIDTGERDSRLVGLGRDDF